MLNDSNKPIAFVTAGARITPFISMLNYLKATERSVYFIQSALNTHVHAFRTHLISLASKNNHIKPYFFIAKRLSLANKIRKDFGIYLYNVAPKLGIPSGNVYVEIFGPAERLTCDAIA